MSGRRSDRHDVIWEHLRRVIFGELHAVLGPPPRDVMRKSEDVLHDAR